MPSGVLPGLAARISSEFAESPFYDPVELADFVSGFPIRDTRSKGAEDEIRRVRGRDACTHVHARAAAEDRERERHLRSRRL